VNNDNDEAKAKHPCTCVVIHHRHVRH